MPLSLFNRSLFTATQNTAFGIFVVETLPTLVMLGSKVKIEVEIEHQHLAIVMHDGGVGCRSKRGQVFGDGGRTMRRERINHHNAEAEML